MASKQHEDTEGVPVRLDSPPDHRVDGIAVQVPDFPADTPASKPARKRAAKKSAAKKAAATPTGQSAEPTEES